VTETAEAQPRQKGRASLIFAMLGVIVALVAGGLYVTRQIDGPQTLTPEQTVNEFLSAVFLATDTQRVGAVVCKSWDPNDAIVRTRQAVPEDAHVSWDEITVASTNDGRTTVRARLGLRLRDDSRPTSFEQWRFALVDEAGWRVCEARPLIA
jgi:flagellar basal body-associated protein FliL